MASGCLHVEKLQSEVETEKWMVFLENRAE